MSEAPAIVRQLTADREEYDRRVAAKPRLPAPQRYYITPLHRAAQALTDLAYEGNWSREALIQLLDHAIAEAARIIDEDEQG